MSKKSVNRTVKAKSRREKVILRLEAQLVSGVKPLKEADHMSSKATVGVEMVPLSVSEIARINRELETLRSRV